jgi:hypothetical protein
VEENGSIWDKVKEKWNIGNETTFLKAAQSDKVKITSRM